VQVYLIYAVIIFCANVVGSIAGMGGGVIIKPLLDLVGAHPLVQINFFSSVAVFTMAIFSTYRQTKQGMQLNKRFALLISVGAVVGGWLGNSTFNQLHLILKNDALLNQIQIGLTVLTLVFALFYSLMPAVHFHWQRGDQLVLIGAFLGWISTLLGIGGGPINVALIMLCCSIPIREATSYSIVTILFSQLSKLMTVVATGAVVSFDLKALWFVIPAAAIGGTVGAMFSHTIRAQQIELVYRFAIVGVIAINLYNNYLLMA